MPGDLSYGSAVQLVRLQRHVVKRWLLHAAPAGSWCAKLLWRLWTFAGHICRQASRPSQPARVMMGLLLQLMRMGWPDLAHGKRYMHYSKSPGHHMGWKVTFSTLLWIVTVGKPLSKFSFNGFTLTLLATLSCCNAAHGNRQTCFYEHMSHGYTQFLFN